MMILNYADHSANERTFLAWVRTVIAIEGFGIAAGRVGGAPAASWTEPVLLLAGAVVIGLAFIRMRHIRARIELAEAVDDEAGPADALLLVLVGALFMLIAAFALHLG
jgi:putative membrane protein